MDAQECEQGLLKTELRHESRCKESRDKILLEKSRAR